MLWEGYEHNEGIMSGHVNIVYIDTFYEIPGIHTQIYVLQTTITALIFNNFFT